MGFKVQYGESIRSDVIVTYLISKYKLFFMEEIITTKVDEEAFNNFINSFNTISLRKGTDYTGTLIYECVLKDDSTGEVFAIDIDARKDGIRSIKIYGKTEECVSKIISELLKFSSLSVDDIVRFKIWNVSHQSGSGLDYDDFYIHPKRILSKIDVNLFKYTGVPIDKVIDFLKSDSSLLILFGKPGVGKSKLVVSAATIVGAELEYTCNLFKGTPVIEQLVKNPGILMKNDKIFIFDDLDTINGDLTRSSGGLAADFVSILLTASDGLIPTNSKYIITTNLPLRSIDKALLRPGRLYGAYELKPFNAKDAGLDVDKEVTLAEFIMLKKKQKVEIDARQKIGF